MTWLRRGAVTVVVLFGLCLLLAGGVSRWWDGWYSSAATPAVTILSSDPRLDVEFVASPGVRTRTSVWADGRPRLIGEPVTVRFDPGAPTVARLDGDDRLARLAVGALGAGAVSTTVGLVLIWRGRRRRALRASDGVRR